MNRIVLAALALFSCASLSAQSTCEIPSLYESTCQDLDADGVCDDVDTWIGTVFTGPGHLWFDVGNWDNGLPAIGNNAKIPAGLTVEFEVNMTTPLYIFDTDWGLLGTLYAESVSTSSQISHKLIILNIQ